MTRTPVPTTLRIATWNLYLGADLRPVLLAADAEGLGRAALAAMSQAERTRFPERARVIAEVIAKARPDVIGLQEVVRWQVRSGAGRTGLWNHLDLIFEALESAGETYVTLYCSDTFSGEFGIDADRVVEFTNCDAMLLRDDPERPITVLDAGQGHFDARLTIPLEDREPIEVKRGWVHADLESGGQHLRVVTTHLDSVSKDIRLRQAHELVSAASPSPYPTVVVGDFNTEPGDGVTEVMAHAGYQDAWNEDTDGPGLTWGRSAELDTDEPLSARLDYVFVDPEHLRVGEVEIIGADDSARTESAPHVWASDHAGVLAEVTIV